MKIIIRVLLLLSLLLVVSCTMPITPRYSISAKNVVYLRDTYGNSQKKIKVGEFTSQVNNISCRWVDIKIPDGLTIAEFVKNGFSDELKMSGVYSETSNTVLTGKILTLDVDCDNTITGRWISEVEIAIGKGKPFIVKNVYEFEEGFMGDVAYKNAQQSLNYALQELFDGIIRNDNFKAALR
jgi:hypothetical protein